MEKSTNAAISCYLLQVIDTYGGSILTADHRKYARYIITAIIRSDSTYINNENYVWQFTTPDKFEPFGGSQRHEVAEHAELIKKLYLEIYPSLSLELSKLLGSKVE